MDIFSALLQGFATAISPINLPGLTGSGWI